MRRLLTFVTLELTHSLEPRGNGDIFLLIFVLAVLYTIPWLIIKCVSSSKKLHHINYLTQAVCDHHTTIDRKIITEINLIYIYKLALVGLSKPVS